LAYTSVVITLTATLTFDRII